MIKWITIVIIGLIVLGILGYNIKDIVNQPIVRDNLEYGKEIALNVWNKFLKGPAEFIWQLIIKYIFNPIINIVHEKVQGLGKKETSVNSRDAFFLYQQGILYILSA